MIKDNFKEFYLLRAEDISGISGTGLVARGCVFPSGVAILEFNSLHSSINHYKSLNDVLLIHGHDGKTKIMIGNPYKGKAKEFKG